MTIIDTLISNTIFQSLLKTKRMTSLRHIHNVYGSCINVLSLNRIISESRGLRE